MVGNSIKKKKKKKKLSLGTKVYKTMYSTKYNVLYNTVCSIMVSKVYNIVSWNIHKAGK